MLLLRGMPLQRRLQRRCWQPSRLMLWWGGRLQEGQPLDLGAVWLLLLPLVPQPVAAIRVGLGVATAAAAGAGPAAVALVLALVLVLVLLQ